MTNALLNLSWEVACVALAVAAVIAVIVGVCWAIYPRRTADGDQYLTPTIERRYREAQGHE